jgi:AcrR family transcriptional regulator
MSTKRQIPLEPRKTPVQARSTVTVEAIYEATFQVLLAVGGPERLTTTRVAERAGVSVGTLYQYFPNKQSLLFSVLEKHLDRVVSAVELACRRNHGQQVSTMIESVVEAFVDAKMERLDISMALYATVGAQERSLTNKVEKRARAAIASMLATAPNTKFADLPFTSLMLISAMGGATRAVLEAGASPRMVRLLRKQLVLLCRGFLMSVAAQT